MEKVIEIAKSEIGYKEQSGKTKYFTELFPEEKSKPWCLPFIEWVFVKRFGKETASKMLYMPDGVFSNSISALILFVKNNGKWYRKTAKPGWIVFLRMTYESINHVELVIDVSDETITSIGGNCGGEVKENVYQRNDIRIAGYAEIDYEDTEATVE